MLTQKRQKVYNANNDEVIILSIGALSNITLENNGFVAGGALTLLVPSDATIRSKKKAYPKKVFSDETLF